MPSENTASSPSSGGRWSHDEIAREAYAIYLARKGAPGDPVRDWVEAEQRLGARTLGAAAAAPPGTIATPPPQSETRGQPRPRVETRANEASAQAAGGNARGRKNSRRSRR